MIYDVRGNKEEEITEIKFDDWGDNLVKDQYFLMLKSVTIAHWKDFDSFIAACHKAKELWGPKE